MYILPTLKWKRFWILFTKNACEKSVDKMSYVNVFTGLPSIWSLTEGQYRSYETGNPFVVVGLTPTNFLMARSGKVSVSLTSSGSGITRPSFVLRIGKGRGRKPLVLARIFLKILLHSPQQSRSSHFTILNEIEKWSWMKIIPQYTVREICYALFYKNDPIPVENIDFLWHDYCTTST